MAMNLSQWSPFGSLWTSNSKYIIDFQRGLVTHSKLLTKGQFNRFMSKQQSTLQRPDLNPRQAFRYFRSYLLGQKYLQFLRLQHQNQIYKLVFQSSSSYFMNHLQEFQRIENQLAFPVTQFPYGGYVRTSIERDNLVNYVQKIKQKVAFYGMKKIRPFDKQEISKRTYNNLRNIAFKPRQVKIQAAEETSDQ